MRNIALTTLWNFRRGTASREAFTMTLTLTAIIGFALSVTGCARQQTEVPPDSVEVPGYGTLVYERTLVDDGFICDTVVDGNSLWSLDNEAEQIILSDAATGSIARYGLTGAFDQTLSQYVAVRNLIPVDDSFVVAFQQSSADDSRTDFPKYVIAEFDKVSRGVTARSLPTSIQDPILSSFFGRDGVLYAYFFGLDSASYYGCSADAGATWSAMTQSAFESIEDSVSAPSGAYPPGMSGPHAYLADGTRRYAIDNRSVSYTDTSLYVSADSGQTWHSAPLGTNYGNSVAVDGDLVYVSSHCYYEAIGFIPTQRLGGGVLVFRWQID